MSASKIVEKLLDEDPKAWETANLLHEHYSGIVRRRGKAHFDRLKIELPTALSESIGGVWNVELDKSLHKKQGYPLRIRNVNWPSANGFVIGFEYNEDDYRGGACFGLIHTGPIHENALNRRERHEYYPDQPSTAAPGFDITNYWLAKKTIKNSCAPKFVPLETFVELTKVLVAHYDKASEPNGKGWLSSQVSLDRKNKAA